MVKELAVLTLMAMDQAAKPQPPEPADMSAKLIPELVKSLLEALRPVCEVIYWQGAKDGFLVGLIAGVIIGMMLAGLLRPGAK